MPTVQEILKQSGFTDEQISAFDARAIEGFSKVLTTAEQAEKSAREAREAAELAKRTQDEDYETKIAPALDKWGNEAAELRAREAFYRTQNEEARKAGFIAQDAPGYKPQGGTPPGSPQRGANGEFVAGASGVPGSPAYMTQVEGLQALSDVNWTNNEYFRLFKTVPPDDFSVLVAEAARMKLPYKQYVEQKYGFPAKRTEIQNAQQKERDDKIRAEAIAENDKKWAERGGNNPNVRVGQESQFSAINKGIQAGTLKDPTTMTKEERHRATQSLIQKDIAENMAGARQ